VSVLLCFIDPRVRKIRKEPSSCIGFFSRTLRRYYVAGSPGSPLNHLLDRHRYRVWCFVLLNLTKEPSPPGEVSYLLCSPIKSVRKRTRCFEGGPLTQGSWWGNIVNRKTSRGGGFFRSNRYWGIVMTVPGLYLECAKEDEHFLSFTHQLSSLGLPTFFLSFFIFERSVTLNSADTTRPYESWRIFKGLAPPRGPYPGTSVVQNISILVGKREEQVSVPHCLVRGIRFWRIISFGVTIGL